MLAKPDHNTIFNPPTGLVSFFLFNSQATEEEYDVFGGNDGVVTGGSWESNDQGLTYLLEDEDYINFGGTEWSISDEFTIFMRLCLRSNVAGIDYDSIIQRGRYFFPFAVRLTTGNNLNFATRTTAMNYLNSTSTLSLNEWYDLVFTRDKNGVKNIYINGVNDGTDTQAGDLDFGSGQETLLGKDYDAGVLYSDIEIACLIMFNKALTEGQVKYFDPFEMFYRNRFRGFHVAVGGTIHDITPIVDNVFEKTSVLAAIKDVQVEAESINEITLQLGAIKVLSPVIDNVFEIVASTHNIKSVDVVIDNTIEILTSLTSAGLVNISPIIECVSDTIITLGSLKAISFIIDNQSENVASVYNEKFLDSIIESTFEINSTLANIKNVSVSIDNSVELAIALGLLKDLSVIIENSFDIAVTLTTEQITGLIEQLYLSTPLAKSINVKSILTKELFEKARLTKEISTITKLN